VFVSRETSGKGKVLAKSENDYIFFANRGNFGRELFFPQKISKLLLTNILRRLLEIFCRRPSSITISKEIQEIFGKKKILEFWKAIRFL